MARKARIEPIQEKPSLRAWRELRGLRLEDVGEALDMSGQNYGKIERAQVELGVEYIPLLARLYRIAPTDVLRMPEEVLAEAMRPHAA